jgi:hypothetical protein
MKAILLVILIAYFAIGIILSSIIMVFIYGGKRTKTQTFYDFIEFAVTWPRFIYYW